MARTRAEIVVDLCKIGRSADETSRTSASLRDVVLDSAQRVVCEIALSALRDAAHELEQLIAKSRVLDAISVDDESTQRVCAKRAPRDEAEHEPKRKRARTFTPSSVPGKVGYCPQSTPEDRAIRMLVAHATRDPATVQHSFAACIKNALARGAATSCMKVDNY
jgi:predicted phage gp36 major capsid-like protein